MAEWEMQDAPEMMSLNDALAMMRATAAAGGSAKIGPVLLARLVEHVDGLLWECDKLRASLDTPAPTEADAEHIGATGAPATDAERRLFEAWMHGHCWALGATWNGTGYRADGETDNRRIDPVASVTRRLWAAWRDRAALAAATHPPVVNGTATKGQRTAQLEAVDEFDAAKRGER